MTEEHAEENVDQRGEPDGDEEEDEVAEWPIKGPATARQAIVAIAFVFFLGVVVGFILSRTF